MKWNPTPSQNVRRLLGQTATVLRRMLLSREAVLIVLVLIIGTCSPRLTSWDQVQESGVLRLITYNGPTTYYLAGYGPSGFDYAVAKRFADSLGVELEVVEVMGPAEVIEKLRGGAGEIGGGLSITPNFSEQVRFGPPLHNIAAQLVYREGTTPPASLAEVEGVLEIVPGSSAAELLEQAADEHGEIDWVESEFANSEELLYKVAAGEIDHTVAYSHLISIVRRYQPRLKVAFDVAAQQQLAWAFAPNVDKTLYDKAVAFVEELRTSGELAKLIEGEFSSGTVGGAFVGASIFAQHVKTRLPRYESTFKHSAQKYQLDWRLVAAVGYQESHWEPLATSPTGVRGLMMLTNQTARHLGVTNRLDPFQSINGGAKYLRELIDKMPDDIQEPDRTWLALATYNMGYAHLLDIRQVVRERGGDPSRWLDVRQHLPLLMQPAVFRKLKYGYARGRESQQYVGNVRNYYDILRWMTEGQEGQLPEGVDEEEVERALDAVERALEINSPIL
ncbi:MAG: membrane-bound lytic murein transglycosylase MltF [Nevskiales bacterium]